MAQECLEAYGGDTVVHIGEWEGDTGTAAFEKARMFLFVLIRVRPRVVAATLAKARVRTYFSGQGSFLGLA